MYSMRDVCSINKIPNYCVYSGDCDEKSVVLDRMYGIGNHVQTNCSVVYDREVIDSVSMTD